MNKIIPSLFVVAGLIGCAKQYELKSNIDPEAFDTYFAPSSVDIYETVSLLPAEHELVGMVEGEDCQKAPHLAAPDEIRARTQARQHAHKLEANAIIFSGCAEIENPQCHSALICYGSAYRVISQ